jgi:crotonobetainyl-CoA:carnitine CoA-transferase CaiB-like acyl-CoA transferase
MSTRGDTTRAQKLPLDGIRIVDFTAVWAGPHVTQWLAVMGAEVVKIESRLRPDETRPHSNVEPAGHTVASEFAEFNYGKKGCTLNMTQPKAREIVKELVRISDVVVENFGGSVMDR